MKRHLGVFFSKICRDISSFIKSDKNKGHFTWRSFDIFDDISLASSQNEKCLGQSCTENQSTFYVQYLFLENLFFYPDCKMHCMPLLQLNPPELTKIWSWFCHPNTKLNPNVQLTSSAACYVSSLTIALPSLSIASPCNQTTFNRTSGHSLETFGSVKFSFPTSWL
jgi:hypothetical protein